VIQTRPRRHDEPDAVLDNFVDHHIGVGGPRANLDALVARVPENGRPEVLGRLK
jgi:hypothetical protein